MCASTSETHGRYTRINGTINYAEFVRDVESIVRTSNEIYDNWQMKHAIQKDGIENWYLTKSQTEFIELQNESDPVSCTFVYHVVYHNSYEVPCLGFTVHRQDGSSAFLKDVWNFFRKTNADLRNKKMSEILTEMDHPVLFTPVFMLHPCRTADLLTSLPNSVNKVVSFLSAMGPTIHLKFDAKYGSN